MKITINRQQIYTYMFAILGLFMFTFYMWLRFLRERLPREIPFTLTLITFIILLLIIILLMYILYRIRYPKTPPQYILNILKQFITILKPLEILDNIIKQPYIVQRSIIKIFAYIIQRTKVHTYKRSYYVFLIFNIMPKFLLLITFIFDIFILHKIEYFYYLLILNLLPLLYMYIIYTLNKQIELYITYLEKSFYIDIISIDKDYDDEDTFMCEISSLKDHKDYEDTVWDYGKTTNTFKDVRFFIDMQAHNLIFDYKMYEYTCVETDYAREEYKNKYKSKIPINYRNRYVPNFDEISILLRKNFEYIIPKVIYIKAFLDVNLSNKKPKKLDKIITIITLTGYIICWLYILIFSMHTLNLLDILPFIQNSWTYIPDPFLDLRQHENNDITRDSKT